MERRAAICEDSNAEVPLQPKTPDARAGGKGGGKGGKGRFRRNSVMVKAGSRGPTPEGGSGTEHEGEVTSTFTLTLNHISDQNV